MGIELLAPVGSLEAFKSALDNGANAVYLAGKKFGAREKATFSNEELIRIANLVDGLVENDKYGNIVPSIASSWENKMVDGKQVWTFYLKRDVYWSDYKGNTYGLVTANDFVTSMKYILNYSTGSENYYLPSHLIENAENYYNGTLISNYSLDFINNKINELTASDNRNQLSYYLNIKKVFQKCDLSNTCTTNFDDVGIKAIDDFTLQYTLSKPVPYFLSSLTHYSFLPANDDFINSIGFNNFGTSKTNLLYSGGYLLKDYYHSSRLEYIKNPNYWDKDNIFIDKLIFTKALNYRSPNYDRLSYETGNITEFVLSRADEEGWKKYVTGSDSSGNINNPVGYNTYMSDSPSNFITYYLVYNQNRSNHNQTTLSLEEIDIANIALQNNNFRKALNYSLNRSNYIGDDTVSALSSIVPEKFISYENKDYFDYFIEQYAERNNITIDDAAIKLQSDPFYDISLGNYYLDLSLKELNIGKENLPIKLEFSYYFDDETAIKNKKMIESWNTELNGCSSTENCTFDKVEIVFNNTITSSNSFSIASRTQEYNISIIGIYPDFNDPTAYLNAFSTTGELYPYINHNSHYIDDMISSLDKHYTIDSLDARYKLASELDYSIIFEQNLILPLCLEAPLKQIIVSDLIPFQGMKSSYGLSPFKFKYKKLSSIKYNQKDIQDMREKYEENLHGIN